MKENHFQIIIWLENDKFPEILESWSTSKYKWWTTPFFKLVSWVWFWSWNGPTFLEMFSGWMKHSHFQKMLPFTLQEGESWRKGLFLSISRSNGEGRFGFDALMHEISNFLSLRCYWSTIVSLTRKWRKLKSSSVPFHFSQKESGELKRE